MDKKEVEDKWSKLIGIKEKLEALAGQFYTAYSPRDDGTFPKYNEFYKEFEPFEVEQNDIALSLMREILKRSLGRRYKGIYPAAGLNTRFCYGLGGQWVFVDRAYHNKSRKLTIEGPDGKILFKANTITHDFMSEELPDEIEQESFDVGLIKHPYGKSVELSSKTGYKPPKREAVFSPKWWNGLLMNSVSPLKSGGILLSESDIEINMEKNIDKNVKHFIRKYLRQLEGMKNLLGLPTDYIPFVEYRERVEDTRPECFDYAFYRKL